MNPGFEIFPFLSYGSNCKDLPCHVVLLYFNSTFIECLLYTSLNAVEFENT